MLEATVKNEGFFPEFDAIYFDNGGNEARFTSESEVVHRWSSRPWRSRDPDIEK
jgi:hypothetical protein